MKAENAIISTIITKSLPKVNAHFVKSSTMLVLRFARLIEGDFITILVYGKSRLLSKKIRGYLALDLGFVALGAVFLEPVSSDKELLSLPALFLCIKTDRSEEHTS